MRAYPLLCWAGVPPNIPCLTTCGFTPRGRGLCLAKVRLDAATSTSRYRNNMAFHCLSVFFQGTRPTIKKSHHVLIDCANHHHPLLEKLPCLERLSPCIHRYCYASPLSIVVSGSPQLASFATSGTSAFDRSRKPHALRIGTLCHSPASLKKLINSNASSTCHTCWSNPYLHDAVIGQGRKRRWRFGVAA